MKKRSKFSLSHYRLFSCKMGYLVPIGLTEVLPGDTFQHSTSVFIRVAPMVTPVMHPVHVILHHWFIPTRLLWENWEDFITGGPDGMDASEYPYVVPAGSSGFPIGSLADYLGVPTGIDGLKVSALPFRAYTLLYNECYRDQDLEPALVLSLADGEDSTTSTELMKTLWARDYFTTARPWPQKGPQVTVPVDSTPGEFSATTQIKSNGTPLFWAGGSTSDYGPVYAVGNSYSPLSMGPDGATHLSWYEPALSATTTISSAGGELGSIDINQLREAFALQRFEEHRALYGSRYVEYLRYLGVRSSDARLQRPEYLGGSKQTIQFSEVLQTGTDSADTPVGTMRGHGIGAMRTNKYRRFFEEHGFVISVMTVRPVPVYMQGLPRLWSRRVKEDYFQKELQHIGQQEVMTKELYAGSSSGPVADDKVFGYQNRYDEYRSHESYVSGEFRSVLNSWHMARDFSNEPVLNADFISATPTNRIFAAQQNDTLYCMANHSLQARRIISKYGNPI